MTERYARGHYEDAARVLRETFPGPSYYEERLRVCRAFADLFREDNQRFNRERFLRACAVEEEESGR